MRKSELFYILVILIQLGGVSFYLKEYVKDSIEIEHRIEIVKIQTDETHQIIEDTKSRLEAVQEYYEWQLRECRNGR
jgi:hypothetical protein